MLGPNTVHKTQISFSQYQNIAPRLKQIQNFFLTVNLICFTKQARRSRKDVWEASNAHQEPRGVYDMRFLEWYRSKGDAWLSAAFTHGRVTLLLLFDF
jgi:hypothetical protein